MNERTIPAGGMDLAASRNRVLRNTYGLLSLSMLPTVAGAWLGLQLQLPVGGWMGVLLFLGVAWGFCYAIERNKNSGLGVALLLGFTFFMGIMLSRLLGMVLGLSNGTSLIAYAAGGTGMIFFAMAGFANSIKRDISRWGRFLFMGLVLTLIASVANTFLHLPALHLALSAMICGLFSAYLIWDLNRIVTGGETNYVSATLAVYLDLYNIFTSLLQLITAFGGED